MSRLSSMDKRRRRGQSANRIDGLLRRMSVGDAAALEWQLEGFEDADGNLETETAEVFGAAGVAHIPADGDKAEALVAHLGGDANAPVVAATRNADAIRKLELLEGPMKKGGTYVFSSNAQTRLVLDGSPPVNPLAEPTYKVTTHDVLMQALLASIAGGAALVGGAATSVINAGITAYNAALATAKSGSKLS